MFLKVMLMKINKYLKELGLEWYDLPGNYDEKLEEEKPDVPAADCRNKEDEEGFCTFEFFSLDYTLSLFIYSKLCFFREHIADLATPGCLTSYYNCSSEEERKKRSAAAHQKWLEILDKMIEAFRIQIQGEREGYEGIDREKQREGMQLFIEYYNYLWY